MKHLTQYQDNTFYLHTVIQRQVEREAWIDWARKPNPQLPTRNPFPVLTTTVKQAITRGVSILIA